MLDALIAGRFQAGDLEALREIVQQFQSRLFGLGMRLFGKPEAAADFCQDVFLRAYQKRHLYQKERPFDPWFFKLAVNLGRQNLRRKKEVLADEELAEVPVEPMAEKQVLKQEEAEQVQKALRRISGLHQEALALRFESGLSLQEIAQALGVSLGTVKSRLSRGLVAFRQAYQNLGGEGE